jgi:hypothetical protein
MAGGTMKKIAGVCMTGVLATFLMPVAMVAAPAPAPSGYAGYVQEGGWDVPPGEFDEVTRHGWHDGVEAARADFNDHKEPDVNRHETYRHPDLPKRDREAFRRGFERGYRRATEHLWHRGQ